MDGMTRMSEITVNRRRIMLAAASGAAGLMVAPGIALSQDAPATSSPARGGNVGYYRFRVGEDISATVLSDGLIGGPPRVYASDVPEADLEAVLRQAFLPTDRLTLNLNTLLIETQGRRILLEAGAGETMGPQGGRVFANLAAIGLRPEDIDVVVVSHTHPDHVGNLRTADGGRAFPRATIFAPRADWDFFVSNDPDLSYMPVPEEFRRNFAAAIKRSVEPVTRGIELYDAGAEIVPGLTTLPAVGHTPGMANFQLHRAVVERGCPEYLKDPGDRRDRSLYRHGGTGLSRLGHAGIHEGHRPDRLTSCRSLRHSPKMLAEAGFPRSPCCWTGGPGRPRSQRPPT